MNYVVDVLAAVVATGPRSILEIGPGFGKYGVLLRELLDLRPGAKGGYAPFQLRIDAVEVDARYLTPIHKFVYDEVVVGDAAAQLASLPRKYDVVLLVDVLEHFRKLAACGLLMDALKIARNVVVATPYGYYPQGEVFDNPHEAHLCGFFPSEFREGGAAHVWRKGLAIIAVFSDRGLPLPPAIATPDGPFAEKDRENLVLLAEMYRNTEQWGALEDAGKRALAIEPSNATFNAWIGEGRARAASAR